MSIHLTGLTFDPKVIAELESELLIENYDLSALAFDKVVNPKPYSASYANGIEYMYTVGIYNKTFSVTFADDAQFAHFFRSLCNSDDIKGSLFNKLTEKVMNCIKPIKRWIT